MAMLLASICVIQLSRRVTFNGLPSILHRRRRTVFMNCDVIKNRYRTGVVAKICFTQCHSRVLKVNHETSYKVKRPNKLDIRRGNYKPWIT